MQLTSPSPDDNNQVVLVCEEDCECKGGYCQYTCECPDCGCAEYLREKYGYVYVIEGSNN